MHEHEKLDADAWEKLPLEASGIVLTKTAPAELRKAFGSENFREAHRLWAEYLAAREPKALTALLPARRTTWRGHPLRWALTPAVAVDPLVCQPMLWESWIRSAPNVDLGLLRAEASADVAALSTVREWREADGLCDEVPDEEPLPLWLDGLEAPALRALIWAHVLPTAASPLGSTWWDLLRTLVQLTHDATALDTGRHPLAWQMLGGELGWTLAYYFPELKACRELGDSARETLTRGIDELLDGAGQPHADHFSLVRPLLACWTRCCFMGPHLPRGGWKKKAQEQYEWLVRSAMRLSRGDGTAVLAPPLDLYDAWRADLFQAAVHCSTDPEDAKIAMVALPERKRSDVRSVAILELPEASLHSEWAETAVLRTNWAGSDPTLAVTYANRHTRFEFAVRRQLFWSGLWAWSLRRDGRPVRPDGPWEEVCWVSDDDVDYLELEMALTDDLRVQRHILLAHSEEFVFLGDAILGETPSRLEYTCTLPISPDLGFGSPAETRELAIFSEKQQVRVLPLALSEWKQDTSRGNLLHEPGRLTLTQHAEGRCLFAPWFIDFEPRRARRERLTWRRLTVAENLRTLGDDEAVGYRVQVGEEQWLMYRSLIAPANRTVLGHNLVSEMLVARFNEDGSVENLIEIGG